MAKVKKIIALVRKNPILYDCRVEGHTNAHLKAQVWGNIAEELDDDTEDVKKKWKNLRDTYVKHQKTSKVKSENTKEWTWAADMKFFSPFFGLNRSRSKFGDFNDLSTASNSEDENSLPNFLEIETSFMKNESILPEFSESYIDGHQASTPNTTELQNNQETESVTVLAKPSQDPFSSAKRKKNSKRKFKSTSMDEFGYMSTQRESHDEIDLLLLAYAKTIKKFSAKRQALTKFKIAQIIMEQEVLNLEEQLNPTDMENFIGNKTKIH